MKLLLDEGLPYRAAALLRQEGHDAVHVNDIGLSGKSDELILEAGRTQARIIITLDADFHAMLALTHATEPSVIRLRVEGLREVECCRFIINVLNHCGAQLDEGIAVSASRKIRIRRLPLI